MLIGDTLYVFGCFYRSRAGTKVKFVVFWLVQVLRRGLAAAPWERQKAVLTVLILRIELFLEEIGCAACESKVYDNEERRKGIKVENDFAGKACFEILQ